MQGSTLECLDDQKDAAGAHDVTKPFVAEDLLLHQEITSLHCAYEANIAAVVVESIDKENDSTTSSIWALPLEGDFPFRMTAMGANDILPRWSPDGEKLAFISDRSGANQGFIIPRRGREATQLTNLGGVALSFRWSPNGNRIVVACSVAVDPNLRGKRPDTDTPPLPENPPQLVWKLPYKMDGMDYTLGHEIHLYCVDVDSGVATRLRRGGRALPAIPGRRTVRHDQARRQSAV